MVGVFSWNDVDVLFIFNFDPDIKLSLFQGHGRLRFFNMISLMGTTSFSAYLTEPYKFELNLTTYKENFMILNCVLSRIALYIWGTLMSAGHLIVDRILFLEISFCLQNVSVVLKHIKGWKEGSITN